MPQTALIGTIAVYIVLAVLLLSLNIFSLWKWWVKAAAIVATVACFIVAYLTITAMIGWPTFTALPRHFNVVATRIQEPDRLTGAAGHVYLWVEEINEHNVPVTAPRGYELPYTVKLADDTDTAQKSINTGQKIMGETGGTEAKPGTQAGKGKPSDNMGNIAGKAGTGSQPAGESTAAETIGEAAVVVFSEMPAVELPDKGVIVPPEGQ